LERRDADQIASCFTVDAVYHNMPIDPILGREAIREFFAQRAGMPLARLEIHHQITSDDIVMNERTDYVPHDGRQIALRICGVFEIRDGLIAAWREYFDPAAVTAF